MGKEGVISALFLVWITAASGAKLLTLPTLVEADSETQVCLILQNVARDDKWSNDLKLNKDGFYEINVQVNYTAVNHVEELVLFTQTMEYHNCFTVNTPVESGKSQVIATVTVGFENEQRIILSHEGSIETRVTPLITLIQTDKPIYKPGQTVKFRVMTMDHRMKPQLETYSLISIETPSGTRVKQWRNVVTVSGLVSLEMPLSADPVLGGWKIKATYGGEDTEQYFKVDEYVLPKFEVTVKPPSYLLPSTRHISGTVCAKYTYGKPVKGDLTMEICYKPRHYYYQSRDIRPCSNIIAKIDGCYEFFINGDDLELKNSSYSNYGDLRITANVTEEQTGIMLSGTSKGPSMTMAPLSMRVEDDSNNQFKPGFPFKARVIVTNPDGSPAPGETLIITATSHRSGYEWNNTYSTDDDGVVYFSIDDLVKGLGDVNIRITTEVYGDDWRYISGEGYYRTFPPNAYHRIIEWYSASDSFIYIPDVDVAADCDTELPLDVYFTADRGHDYNFLSVIRAGDSVVDSNKKEIKASDVAFVLNIPADGKYEALIRKEVEVPPTPDYPYIPRPYPRPGPLPPLPGANPELFGPEGEEGMQPVEEEIIVPENVNPLGNNNEMKPKKRLAHFKLEVPIYADYSPYVKLLLMYVRDDGEVIASSIQLNVNGCFQNKAKLSFAKDTVRPGYPVDYTLSASSGSTCFVGMVDKSVMLLGGNNQLSPKQIFDQVGNVARTYSYVSYYNEDQEYCRNQRDRSDDDFSEYNSYWLRPEGEDSMTAFRDVRMAVVSDGQVQTRPCKEQPRYYYSLARGGLPGANGQSGPLPLSNVDQVPVAVKPKLNAGSKTEIPEEVERVRSFFPETWLWDIVNLGFYYFIPLFDTDETAFAMYDADSEVLSDNLDINENVQMKGTEEKVDRIRSFFPETWLWDIVKLGETDTELTVSTNIPDTITEWVGNTLCTNHIDGVGMSDIVGVTAFQPFFVSLTLPYSAIRRETLPVTVTVFNYLEDCIPMVLRFKEMAGFQFRDSGSSVKEFCLCGGDSDSYKFYITPTIVGEIDIEVTAVSVENNGLCTDVKLSDLSAGVSDGVQRQLLIEAEGVPEEKTWSSYICVKGDIDEETRVAKWSLPRELVPDSYRATASVVGDVMGPTLSNLKNLLRMPYGCGEQNMASWAPNIYVLQYLSFTNQLAPETATEAKNYMSVGYQRQMNYRHTDNSYSAWGENSYNNATGSLWLTAFVVKSMAKSAEFIAVDDQDIINSATWLVEKQDENGCFPKYGKVFSSYMKGGLADGDNLAGLTAFTLIALLEANLGDAFEPHIREGFNCLDMSDVYKTDTYTLSVMLYAYTLADHDRRNEVMDMLQRRKVSSGGMVHWKREETEEVEKDVNAWYWYRAPSAEVEMTAYVLLSMLEIGQGAIDADSQAIVQWLTKQRNPYGGFSSTQDTVVALQALAKFGQQTYTGNTAVTVDIFDEHTDNTYTFHVSDDNSLVTQSAELDGASNEVLIRAQGLGCFLAQVSMKYNVYKEEDTGPAFDVEVDVFRSRTDKNNCAMRTLSVCARYLASFVSNMAIVEVKMPTGWIPVKNSIKELVKGNKVQKMEVDKNYVQLYFDGLTNGEDKCVTFEVEQDIRMKPKPALVRVYDYYETSYSVTTQYEIKTTCGTKEEIPLDNEGLDCSIMQCRVDFDDIRESESMSCPKCPRSMDKKEIAQLACESSAIYKATVGREGEYSVKLKSDIRPKKKDLFDQLFVNTVIQEQCSCPILNRGETNALIFASVEDIVRGETITLREGVVVLPQDQAEKIVRRVATRKKLCSKLARLRRSGTERSMSKLALLMRKHKL